MQWVGNQRVNPAIFIAADRVTTCKTYQQQGWPIV
jgi:hypothetical protein